MEYVVEEALNTIPEQSDFYACIKDVIGWYRQYPDDWKQTWFECQKKWTSEVGCPDGVFVPFNIDAKINSAYVAIGLLYGKKDFIRLLIFRHVVGKILIVMRLLLPVYWVQCLDIVIFRNYGKKVFTK